MLSTFSAVGKADFICAGKIKQFRTWQTGFDAVSVDIGYGTWLLCRTSVQYENIQPEMCKVMISTVLSAANTNRSISIQFRNKLPDGTDNPYTTCDQVPDWNSQAAKYMHQLYVNY